MRRTSVRRRLALGVRHALTWNASRVVSWLRWLLTSYVALAITFWILPGDQTASARSLVVIVLTVGLVGIVLRPLLLTLVVAIGSIGLLLVGVLAQAVILDVALSIAPGGYANDFLDVLVASWIASAIVAAVNWVFDAGSEDAYLAQVLGRSVRVSHRHQVSGPGLLVIQLDGLSAPLLRQAVTAGSVPTISRWLGSGRHVAHRWHTGLPSTTPAGQGVLLHRDVTTVPSFRWFEKGVGGAPGRLMVANRPRDAAEIEARMSDGRGLLADGGVSVSNLFSGDAPTRVLTMSDARLPSRRTPGLASFAVARGGFVRSLTLFFGEIASELQQARRQRRRDVLPRVGRGGAFIVLRAVTTVLLRDINVTVVAESMARGAPVIFVDFVDYDEVAHHAGPSRPESMRTLDGLDRVLDALDRIAAEVGRDYEIVVVSDHGQAQGTTFVQRTGETLHALVTRLVGASATTAREDMDAAPAEQWGPANVLLTGAARAGTVASGATRSLFGHGVEEADGDVSVTLGRGGRRRPVPEPLQSAPVVAAAGSIAHVYLPDEPGRVPLDRIDELFPGLVAGLAGHPWIGAVMVRTDDGPVVLGGHGARRLTAAGTADGWGEDPLLAFGDRAASDVLDLDGRDHVGDLVLLGRHDPESGDVTAFEELVGSHGGLGGGQTEAVFLHPAGWCDGELDRLATGHTVLAPPLTGVEVFDVLVGRLRELGLRPGDVPVAAGDRSPATVP